MARHPPLAAAGRRSGCVLSGGMTSRLHTVFQKEGAFPFDVQHWAGRGNVIPSEPARRKKSLNNATFTVNC